LPDSDEVFEEALAAVNEAGVGERVEGAAETDFVACECLETLVDMRGRGKKGQPLVDGCGRNLHEDGLRAFLGKRLVGVERGERYDIPDHSISSFVGSSPFS
jgi:hypothetical protein